jgi:hypothetical protein
MSMFHKGSSRSSEPQNFRLLQQCQKTQNRVKPKPEIGFIPVVVVCVCVCVCVARCGGTAAEQVRGAAEGRRK